MKLPKINVMVDLETMSTKSNAAIVSIGAVVFNEDDIIAEFYYNVDLADSMKYGVVDGDTIMWWLQQSEEARMQLTYKPYRLDKVLYEFSRFITEQMFPADAIWGNGANFDNVILANAYKAVRRDVPWRFAQDMCFRTVRKMLPEVDWQAVEGCAHNALTDAKAQALYLIDAVREANK